MAYIPERGDVIWLTFTPQAGREQSGRRPALVLSPKAYNGKTGLAVVCPITSHIKGYPFEVSLNAGSVQGVALSDHAKNLDWKERRAAYEGKASVDQLRDVTNKIAALLMIE